MSREVGTEFEERRVARLLTGAAAAIPPLSEIEAESLVRDAAAGRSAFRGRRRSIGGHLQVFSVAAVAAAVALALSLPTRGQESEPRSGPASTSGSGPLAAFPEGSALQLLLSPRDAGHA